LKKYQDTQSQLFDNPVWNEYQTLQSSDGIGTYGRNTHFMY